MTYEQLRAELDALPDPDDVPGLSFNQRQAAHEQREVLRQRCATVWQMNGRIADLDKRIAPLESWREALVAVRAELCGELALLEVKDRKQRTRPEEDQLNDIRLGISAIDRGVEWWNGRPVTGLALVQRLAARGVIPRPGETHVWVGRSSLVRTDDLLEELRRQRAQCERERDQALGVAPTSVATKDTDATATADAAH